MTVCIPAYQAAGFIERTLRCACEQTHAEQRILVSVDVSTDGTEEICRAWAREDPRVEVIAQPERLGWAGNVNFLLESVTSEFAFLYFHDDLIEPAYSARLVAALRERPDAASAHCDMGHFGASDNVVLGRGFEGSAAVRLLDFLTARRKPALLRSMLRVELAGRLRLPTTAGGMWANQPFLMALVAAGPVLHAPDVLYRRWEQRAGGLTDSWLALPLEEIVAGYRANAREGLAIIDGSRPSASERELLIHALMVHMTLRLRRAEERHGTGEAAPPETLLPEFAGLELPASVDGLPPELREQCEDAARRLERRTARRASSM